MKFRLTPYLITSVVLMLLGACKEKTKVPVPKDAIFVMHFNGASLQSKLSWDEIKQSDIFKTAYAFVPDSQIKAILNNPDVSGIDIKSDAYLFMKKQGHGGYMGFTCEIKDEKAFNSLVEKINSKEKPVKDGNLSVIKGRQGVITWSDNRLVIIGDSPDMNSGKGSRKNNFSKGYSFPEDSLLLFAKEVHNLKKDNSLASDDKFNSLLKESGDIHFWVNMGKLSSGSLPPQMAMMSKAGSLLEDNITTATLNFENGKISVNTKNYYNKELASLFEKYPAKNLDENMLKMIPSDNVNAVIAMNYPPEGLQEFLKLLGVDGLINGLMSMSTKSDFSLTDFINANKGDLLFAVTDLKMKEKEVKPDMDDDDKDEEKMHRNKHGIDAKVLFATSVKDKASFQKIIDLFNKMGGEGEMMKQKMGKFPHKLQDNWFIAGTDSMQVNQFGAMNTNHSFISKISGHPVGGYFDIQKLIAATTQSTKDTMAMLIAGESMKVWKDALFYCDNYKNGAMQCHFEINMMDNSTNSLKQMWNYFGALAKNAMKDRRVWEMIMKQRLPDKMRQSPPKVE